MVHTVNFTVNFYFTRQTGVPVVPVLKVQYFITRVTNTHLHVWLCGREEWHLPTC